jgi:hypothetical protein
MENDKIAKIDVEACTHMSVEKWQAVKNYTSMILERGYAAYHFVTYKTPIRQNVLDFIMGNPF